MEVGMQMRLAAAALTLALSTAASAGGWGGAISGLGDALVREAEIQENLNAQKEIIELQHQREMERLRLQQQLQQQQQQSGDASKVAFRQYLDERHPGWLQVIRAEPFKRWLAAQPAYVQSAYSRPMRAGDAASLLDQFKRDTPEWAQR
jgi:hypothetical protein